MSHSIDLPESPSGAGQKKKAAPPPRARKAARTAASGAKRAPAKKKAAAPVEPQMPDQDAINHMVAEAAYYLAEKRCFAPGFEDADWQAAKEQIAAQLLGASKPVES